MQLIQRADALDAILAQWEPVIGADFAGYRNHCYRVLNLTRAFGHADADSTVKAAIAAAFHDLGIWSARSFDYLAPSRALAMVYLEQEGKGAWAAEIDAMITMHHKLTGAGPAASLVEAFRRADWIDVSLGVLRYGLPRQVVNEVQAAFANEGFHRRLVKLTVGRVLTHPFSPLPMMRW